MTKGYVKSVTELIGQSSCEIKTDGTRRSCRCFVKLEFFNPGGSVKDQLL